MMKRKLRNLPPNPEALIATCSQAGKSSPVNTSILRTNTRRKRRESVFVWAKVTARTNRGVNCPFGQWLHRARFKFHFRQTPNFRLRFLSLLPRRLATPSLRGESSFRGECPRRNSERLFAPYQPAFRRCPGLRRPALLGDNAR